MCKQREYLLRKSWLCKRTIYLAVRAQRHVDIQRPSAISARPSTHKSLFGPCPSSQEFATNLPGKLLQLFVLTIKIYKTDKMYLLILNKRLNFIYWHFLWFLLLIVNYDFIESNVFLCHVFFINNIYFKCRNIMNIF